MEFLVPHDPLWPVTFHLPLYHVLPVCAHTRVCLHSLSISFSLFPPCFWSLDKNDGDKEKGNGLSWVADFHLLRVLPQNVSQ